MNCQNEAGCEGDLRTDKIRLGFSTDHRSYVPALACSLCGRIHTPAGQPLFDAEGNPAFLTGNGQTGEKLLTIGISNDR